MYASTYVAIATDKYVETSEKLYLKIYEYTVVISKNNHINNYSFLLKSVKCEIYVSDQLFIKEELDLNIHYCFVSA